MASGRTVGGKSEIHRRIQWWIQNGLAEEGPHDDDVKWAQGHLAVKAQMEFLSRRSHHDIAWHHQPLPTWSPKMMRGEKRRRWNKVRDEHRHLSRQRCYVNLTVTKTVIIKRHWRWSNCVGILAACRRPGIWNQAITVSRWSFHRSAIGW